MLTWNSEPIGGYLSPFYYGRSRSAENQQPKLLVTLASCWVIYWITYWIYVTTQRSPPMTPITLSSVTYTHADLTFIVHNGVRSCACCGYLLEMRYVDLSSNCAL